MTMGLNKCEFIGHLGRDPQGTPAGDGKRARTTFSLAVNEQYITADGDKNEIVTWVNFVAFDRIAETCYQYLKKGQAAFVSGKLQFRKYTGRDGIEKIATEIVANQVIFFGNQRPSQDAQPANENRSQGDPGSQPPVSEQSRPKDDTFDSLGKTGIDDSDIPFRVDLFGDNTCPINIASSAEEISPVRNFTSIPTWLMDILVSAKNALEQMSNKIIRKNIQRNVPTSA